MVKNLIYSALFHIFLILKVSNTSFVLGTIIRAVSNKIYLKFFSGKLFFFNLFLSLYLFVNVFTLVLLVSLSLYFTLLSFDLACFVLNLEFLQNQLEIYFGNPVINDNVAGYSFLVDQLPNLLKFLKHISLSAPETEFLKILNQIDLEGAESLTLEQKSYVIQCLNAQYLYHSILLYSNEGLPFKEVFLMEDCLHYLRLLDATRWVSCVSFLDTDTVNEYFKNF